MKSLSFLALILLGAITAFAQTPPAGTVISNQATVRYVDPSGNTHNETSNTVTFTVAKVGGLAITPDAQVAPGLVATQTQILSFTIANTGNYDESVLFPASGAGIVLTGPATITRAVIDLNGNGLIDVGETDIFTNSASVTSALIPLSTTIKVLVEVQVNAGAVTGNVTVALGDTATNGPSFDDQAADTSANEIRTIDATAVNGLREAKGNFTFPVLPDTQIQVTLTAPPGPVSVNDVMNYVVQACNPSATKTLNALTLAGAPGGSNNGVFIIVPIPANTILQGGQTFPAGTLYSIDPVAIAPTLATWTTVAPALPTITRIAFNAGASLLINQCSPLLSYNVIVQPTITSTTVIAEIADTFGTNTVGAVITDQSGDPTPTQGNGNASTVPVGGTAGVTGIPQLTPVAVTIAVLNGTFGYADASGPTNNNDDYTNKGGNLGLAGVAVGGLSTAANIVVFDNTVQNRGDINDSFTLSPSSLPAGATVELSSNGGTTWLPSITTATLTPNQTVDYKVRVTLPVGSLAYTGLNSVIRAVSVADVTKSNNTIDRVYLGFVTVTKAQIVANSTGIGSLTTAVPGALIDYQLSYTNITSSGGTNCVTLAASNVVITEDGSIAANNWAAYTNYQPGESDSLGGTIVLSNSSNGTANAKYVNTIPALAPGASGTFIIKRLVK